MYSSWSHYVFSVVIQGLNHNVLFVELVTSLYVKVKVAIVFWSWILILLFMYFLNVSALGISRLCRLDKSMFSLLLFRENIFLPKCLTFQCLKTCFNGRSRASVIAMSALSQHCHVAVIALLCRCHSTVMTVDTSLSRQ